MRDIKREKLVVKGGASWVSVGPVGSGEGGGENNHVPFCLR